MRAIARKQPLLSLEEWAHLDEDAEGELVDGILQEEEVATALHEIVVRWLLVTLSLWARTRPAQVFGSELKIATGARRGRKPDVSVFVAELPNLNDPLVRERPLLVVEVLSPRPSDARRDRVEKVREYAQTGICHYWIVDPQLRTFEMLRLERGAYMHSTSATGKIRLGGFAGLVLDLDDLWREVDRAGRSRSRRRSARGAR